MTTVTQSAAQAPQLLSPKGVTEEFGLPESSVRYYANTGRLPAPIRLGSRMYWQREVLVRWFAAQAGEVKA